MHPLVADVEDDRLAVIDAGSGRTLTYGDLARAVEKRTDDLGWAASEVVFLGASNDERTVIDLLALVRVGATVALIDPAASSEVLHGWDVAYRPAGVLGFDDDERRANSTGRPATTDRVLLATSGSTGSPKFVRLSEANVVSNANQIAEGLSIGESDRALAHLPLHYSYGLSVLTSHLACGASVVLTGVSAIRPEFWQAMRDHAVTSLPGVPYSYEMYRRAGLQRLELPSLRTLTQAGGRMASEKVLEWSAVMRERGVDLWVMYGQTEATARISILPPDELPEAAGSVGYAIPGGSLEIVDPDADGVGEVVYSGPNVMLGYAEGASQLNGGDELAGRLSTGDLGRLDELGRLWIAGRLKRIAKVFGTRVSLDDVEREIGDVGELAVVDSGDGVCVFLVSEAVESGLARSLERRLGFPVKSVRVETIEALPRNRAGKVDYGELKSRC